MNWRLLGFICLIILGATSTHASWNCFGLYLNKPSNKAISTLAQSHIDIINKVNIGDFVSIKLGNKLYKGQIKYFNFREIYITSEAEKVNTIKISKIKKLEDIDIIQVTNHLSQNRFKQLIEIKKKEATYLSQDIELKKEFSLLSQLPKEEQVSYNQYLANHIEKQIKKIYSTSDIGFHFNLNGGQITDYVNLGGVRASRGGDIAIQYGARNAVISPQVYFFRANDQMGLYEIISQGNMKSIRSQSGRMGSVMNVFRADAPIFQSGLENGLIKDTGLSYLYSEKWLRTNSKNEVGVPLSEYLTFPLEVYNYKRFGYGRLNRNQEDFLVLKQLEFHLIK